MILRTIQHSVRACLPLLIFFAGAFLFLSFYPVRGASFSSAQDLLGNPTASVASNHTVSFRSTSGVSTGTIVVNLSNVISSIGSVDFSDIDLEYSGIEQTLASSAAANTWGAALSNAGVLTFTYPTACTSPCIAVSAGATVTVRIGTNASGGDAKMTNTASAGSQLASIRTTNDSGVFAVAILSNSTLSVTGTADIPSGTTSVASPAPAPTTTTTTTITTTETTPTPTTETAPTTSTEITAPTPAPTQTTPTTEQAQPPPPIVPPSSVPSAPTTPAVSVPPPLPISIPQAASAVLSAVQPTIINAASGGGGGTVSATIPVDAFKTSAGRTSSFRARIQPMSGLQAVLWTGCTNVNPRRLLGGVAHNVYAENTEPENAGDVAGDPVKPVIINVTYTEKDIEQQGFIEESLRAFGFDPENCNQLVPFVRDPIKKTITITAFAKTFFAVTGELRPGFVERDVAGEARDVDLVSSNINQGDLNVPDTASANTHVDVCLKSSLFKKPVKKIFLSIDATQHQLSYDRPRDCFALSFDLPKKNGEQEIVLKIIYVDDQVQIIRFTALITSNFQATLLGFALPLLQQINERVGRAVEQTQPILQTAAVAAVPVVGVANPSLVSNALNWYYYLNHFFSWLLSLLGLRKKRKPWGIVYNSITKMPVDLVIVRLFEKGTKHLVETQVTDKNGRFSFLAPPGEYAISATKNPLVFPSALIKGTIDGDYSDIYREESFTITSPDQPMHFSIPLDPPKVEHVVVAGHAGLAKRWKTFVGHNPLVPLLGGFLVAEVLTLYIPNTFNYTLLGLNGFFVLTQILLGTRSEKAWGLVFDALTSEPVPLAAITLFDAKEGKMLRTRLSDYFGRFSFLTPTGQYMLAVTKEGYAFPAAKDMHIRKYHHLYFGEPFSVKGKRSVVKSNIPIVPAPPSEQTTEQVVPVQEQPTEPQQNEPQPTESPVVPPESITQEHTPPLD